MSFFDKALEAKVMSTTILIRANVSKAILLQAYKIATDFEKRYSAYKKESYLSKINTQASREKVACKVEDMRLFKRCIEASSLTGGEFDVSIGALSHGAYHFGFSNQKIATETQIKKNKDMVDFKSIVLENEAIFFKKDGMRLDLGGIGKGYVAKLIAQFLQDRGASRALIDVGGEIVSFGKSYTVAIKNPSNTENIIYLKTSKEAISISTSGDYERYIDSPENNHILNKESGKSSNHYSSLTLLKNGFDIDMLDAFATALFNKDAQYIKDFSQTNKLGSITIDSDLNITFNNTKSLKLSHFFVSKGV